MTIKRILQNNRLYLLRLSFPVKIGTIKIHIIFQDDLEIPHTHPWNFKSLLLIPYKESLYYKEDKTLIQTINHRIFTKVKRNKDIYHKVSLYKIFGIKIPSITIGKYEPKTQLCSFCQDLGYCKTERK